MDKTCETYKHSKEQVYTGYFPHTPLRCCHPEREHENFYPLRDSTCDKWESK
jgi:hypothetical protein